jgi:prepilin-type N-terminal cleavage/methylation domain-containing protein
MTAQRNRPQYRGFSLLELLAVVTILVIIAVVVIPRIGVPRTAAQSNAADDPIKAEINSAVERWYFEKGTWPANDLSDIGADSKYFPTGLPTNPVDNSAYSLNATTHRVN